MNTDSFPSEPGCIDIYGSFASVASAWPTSSPLSPPRSTVSIGVPMGNTQAELWKQLNDLIEMHSVMVRWVRGHNGVTGNVEVDQAASAAAIQEYSREGLMQI